MEETALPKYWLCVTNGENWDIIIEKKIWGVTKANSTQIERIQIGDHLIFYVTPKKIGGAFKAASESFFSQKKIFSWVEYGKPEIFPYRIRLEPIIIPKRMIQFDELVKQLSFIKNKKKWSLHLRRPIKLLPKKDYDIIYSALKGK